MKVRSWLLALVLFLAMSCGHGGAGFNADGLYALYTPVYADGFELYEHGRSTVLEVKRPWQGAEGDGGIFYFLSRDGEQAPSGFDGMVIDLPLENAVCMSSSYVAFLEKLGSQDIIKGVSGAEFISSGYVRHQVAERNIRDVGYENGLNYEVLIDIDPDVIFAYGVNGENSVVTAKVRELGINTLYIGEYLENTALGKAEWLVVFGEICGKRELAENIFAEISSEYEAAKLLVAEVAERPQVMLNAPWRDVWFVPGDSNYMVRLINDAGGSYVCAGEDTPDTRPIGVEQAYVYAVKADMWLNPGSADNVAELIAVNPGFKDIPSVRKGDVFNNNAVKTPGGGSDFWESGAVSPDVVLKDLIKIMHPELLPEYEMHYYKKLD